MFRCQKVVNNCLNFMSLLLVEKINRGQTGWQLGSILSPQNQLSLHGVAAHHVWGPQREIHAITDFCMQ